MTETIDASTGELIELQPHDLARYEGEGGLEAARVVAKQLDHFIRERGLAVKIQRGEHLKVEAWCALGTMMGVSPRTAWTKPIEVMGQSGFNARVEVVRISSGEVIGAAEALCMDGEQMGRGPRWKDLHAMQSMAQTRATSKALGQVLRWIPELAGYSGTPAEEMPPAKPNLGPKENYPPPPKWTQAEPAEDAVTVVKEVLGAQEVNTSSKPFGETAKGVTEKQASRALVIASKSAAKHKGTRVRQVLNTALNQLNIPTVPMGEGVNRDEILLHICENVQKGKQYELVCELLEDWKPPTEEPF